MLCPPPSLCQRVCMRVHAHIKHSVHDRVLLADLGHTELHVVNTQSEAKFDSQSPAS